MWCTMPTLQNVNAHGYTHEMDPTSYVPDDYHGRRKSMNKVHTVLRVLMRELAKPELDRVEWIMATDSDTIIYDPSIAIHDLIPSAANSNFKLEPEPLILGNQDFNGFNAGVMFFRVTRQTVTYLAELVVKEEELAKAVKEADAPGDLSETIHFGTDQEVFAFVLQSNEEMAAHFYEIPQYWFNAYAADPEKNAANPHEETEPLLQVHFVAQQKFSVSLDPYLDHANEVYQEALDVIAEMGREGEGNGLEFMPNVDRAKTRAKAWWGREGKKNGIDGFTFNYF